MAKFKELRVREMRAHSERLLRQQQRRRQRTRYDPIQDLTTELTRCENLRDQAVEALNRWALDDAQALIMEAFQSRDHLNDLLRAMQDDNDE